MQSSRRDAAFLAAFIFAFGTASLWLLLGVLPAVASEWPAFHDALHRWGQGDGLSAQVALNVAHTTHSAQPVGQVVLDYLFSVFNLGLGLLLIKLRPGDLTARLLAFGLVGTSVAFNLQGHDALQVIPASFLSQADVWHVLLHVISGLCYFFALLLFPEGRLRPRHWLTQMLQVPVLAFLALVATGLSLITTDDHTLGLVLVFGIFIAVAGLAAQLVRVLRPASAESRQQSKVLLGALALALSVAVPLALFTTSGGPEERKEEVVYEVTAPAEGTYFFRCDPHPDDMIGIVEVVGPNSSEAQEISRPLALSARDNDFNQNRITLVAGREHAIRFTNFDADLHNVAIYEDNTATDPLFIGAEFSGNNSARFAFRIFRLVFTVIPVALFAGLIRFRLWDIDRVINRTLVYGLLAGLITLVYLGVVVVVGTALGVGSRGNLVLSILLTAIVALAFQPLRERARQLVNRLVYGKRATPYEVLTEFSKRVGDAYAVDEVLPRMAQTVGEATGAARVDIWLKVDAEMVRSVSWPEEAETHYRLPINGDEFSVAGADRTVPVRHQGELLGAITLVAGTGEELTPVEEQLLQDVASQAGLVLKNAQLTVELQARLADLQASRHRIVSAQDAERRRLERDIHDGAQQQLVALSIKLRLAQERALTDPSEASRLLDELQTDTTDALQTLRDLARGIFPPVLSDKGLVSALEAHARRCPVDVRITGNVVTRLPTEIENAVYFCCLEAIQNAVKHAGAGPVSVTLEADKDRLRFSIDDLGPGFDPASVRHGDGIQNMTDRIASLGGDLSIDSHPKRGTTVAGEVPLSASTRDDENSNDVRAGTTR
ncbi:MAG: histidine kinase [Actinomycetota bacterium]